MAKKRKRPDEGGGGGYSWMDTYGDLVTLLLCFFVMLLAMSNTDEAKIKEIVQSFSGIPRPVAVPFDPGPPNLEAEVQLPEDIRSQKSAGDDPMQQSQSLIEQDRRFWELYEKLKEYVKEAGLENQVDVQKGDFSITMRFMDSIFFDSGEYELKPDSIRIIDQLIPFLDENTDVIESLRIEGHTDDRPINNSVLHNNWWLSLYRAGSVVDYLHKHSAFDPAKIAAEGLGEYHPIDTNDTEAGRARNRRVEFVIEEKKSLHEAKAGGENAGEAGTAASEPPAQFPTTAPPRPDGTPPAGTPSSEAAPEGTPSDGAFTDGAQPGTEGGGAEARDDEAALPPGTDARAFTGGHARIAISPARPPETAKGKFP